MIIVSNTSVKCYRRSESGGGGTQIVSHTRRPFVGATPRAASFTIRSSPSYRRRRRSSRLSARWRASPVGRERVERKREKEVGASLHTPLLPGRGFVIIHLSRAQESQSTTSSSSSEQVRRRRLFFLPFEATCECRGDSECLRKCLRFLTADFAAKRAPLLYRLSSATLSVIG